MSYTIMIGQARLDVTNSDAYEYESINVDVDKVVLEEAPHFPNDEMTGRSNTRSPAYSVWSGFVDAVGLRDLFFGEDGRDGLMGQHPGCVLLTQRHHDRIASAVAAYQHKHPQAEPGFATEKLDDKGRWIPGEYVDEHYDPMYARLLWLEWWVRWTLANCKIPAIANW